jgi:hypothetical protein
VSSQDNVCAFCKTHSWFSLSFANCFLTVQAGTKYLAKPQIIELSGWTKPVAHRQLKLAAEGNASFGNRGKLRREKEDLLCLPFEILNRTP